MISAIDACVEVRNDIWARYKLDDGTRYADRVLAIGRVAVDDGLASGSEHDFVLLRHNGDGRLRPVNKVAANEEFMGLSFESAPEFET